MNRVINQEKVKHLSTFLAIADEGFCIYTTKTMLGQDEVIKSLRGSEISFSMYDCLREESRTINKILQWVGENKATKVLVIKNFQGFLRNDKAYRSFNLAREEFGKYENVIVFGMLEDTELQMSNKAMDFHTFFRVIERFEITSVENKSVLELGK